MAVSTPSKNGHRAKVVDADLIESMADQIKELREVAEQSSNNAEIYQEALAELELALEDVGWQRLAGFGSREFSITGLMRIRRLARLSYLKNPLIRHPVDVQTHYVWGQGCTISCAASEDVNDVIQTFLDDPKNVSVFSGHQARLLLEVMLQVEGDHFFAMFTNQRNGRVVIRRIVPDEIRDIITNPGDVMEPWFYKREWSERTFDENTGAINTNSKFAYYPDWRLTYVTDPNVPHPMQIGGYPVLWDAPIYHMKVGNFSDQRFGCSEIYPALDWARAVKEDLEDYATIRRAHSRFAFKMSTKGGKYGVKAAKQFLGTTLDTGGQSQPETNPPAVTGATWIQSEMGDLSPMKTAGMVPSPDEGRRLWLMVSAGTGIPLTILSGDADVGNLATAKTLDRPTELQMENRRTLWSDVFTDILNYVIDQAIKAPLGKLHAKGGEVYNDYADQVSYELDDEEDREIDIRFPSILRHEILPLIQAIVWATTLNGQASAGLLDDRTVAQLMLTALGENEWDPVVAQMFPQGTLTVNAGTGAAPAGVTSPPPTRAEQSGSDSGMGDMGGGNPVDNQPGDTGTPTSQMTASNRPVIDPEREKLIQEAFRRVRHGRSGSRLMLPRARASQKTPVTVQGGES